MRKTEFKNEEFYHIYNRGVDKREVFLDEEDYIRFLNSMREFNDDSTYEQRMFEKELSSLKELSSTSVKLDNLVEIVCYCINPNHYHIILKQLRTNGVKTFMHKIGTGYTNYFNKKYKRSGSLFQGPFKSIYINSNEYLLYLSAYVNKNNFIHGYRAEDWEYSSLLDYLGKRAGTLCNKESIMVQFNNNIGQYGEFLKNNALYLKEKKETAKYLLEE
jgi:REP element-mobilizing transposase RayT